MDLTESHKRIGKAIVYLMQIRKVTQADVAYIAGCTHYAVHHVIYNRIRSDRIDAALCKSLGFQNRVALEAAACDAFKNIPLKKGEAYKIGK